MSFSLSMNTTTLPSTLTLPSKGLMALNRVSGFSTTNKVQLKMTRRSGRMSLIVAQSSSNNGHASVKVEYEKVLKELDPVSRKHVQAVTKRVNKWKEYVIARKETKLELYSWAYKLMDIAALQNQLRVTVVNTSSTSEDVASLKVKYFEAVKELKTLASNFVEAGMSETERLKQFASAREDAKYSWYNWDLMRKAVTRLQSQLGISVDESSPSTENDGIASLKVKYNKVLMELSPTNKKYREARTRRFMMGNDVESEEELLAWESWEMKKLEVLELQMQMYILRPGINTF